MEATRGGEGREGRGMEAAAVAIRRDYRGRERKERAAAGSAVVSGGDLQSGEPIYWTAS